MEPTTHRTYPTDQARANLDRVPIGDLIDETAAINRAKGHRTPDDVPDFLGLMHRLALGHTELSEAVQILKRKGDRTPGKPAFDDWQTWEEFSHELADAVIRIFDLAHLCQINLPLALRDKMDINAKRPFLYGTPQERYDDPSKAHR